MDVPTAGRVWLGRTVERFPVMSEAGWRRYRRVRELVEPEWALAWLRVHVDVALEPHLARLDDMAQRQNVLAAAALLQRRRRL